MPRSSVVEQFYASAIYKRFRISIILQRGLRCEEEGCGKAPRSADQLHLHHLIELTPDNIHDASITLNPERVMLLCHDCHDKRHGRFGAVGAKQVFLVYGPPCGGQQEFLADVMLRGDLLIDIDRIFAAISGLHIFDKPDCLLSNARAVQSALLDNVRTRYGKWRSAYVVGGYPARHRREQLANELGAALVYCESSAEECRGRLAMAAEIADKVAWHGYIDRWFDEYQP